jgi:hypothetical protein
MWVALEGFEMETVFQSPTEPREPEPAVAGRAARRRARPTPPRFGDCRDLDEYSRFQAMPPITAAEIEEIDWDDMLDDLLEE